jgi:hypothetical protein
MDVAILLAVAMVAIGAFYTIRGYRSMAFMSDGVSGWATQPACTSDRVKAVVYRRGKRMTPVPLEVRVEVFTEGLVVTTPLSRIEAAPVEISIAHGRPRIRRGEWEVVIRQMPENTLVLLQSLVRR